MRPVRWAWIVLAAAAGARAQSRPAGPPVVLVEIDGREREGTWLGADELGIHVRFDRVETFRPEDLMLAGFAGSAGSSRPAEGPATDEVLCLLADGGRLIGRWLPAPDGQVRVRNRVLGEAVLRFAELRAVRLGGVAEDTAARAELERWLADPPTGDDVLIALAEGRVTSLRGALRGLSPDGGRFTYGGRDLPIRPAVAYAVVFGGGSWPEAQREIRVHIDDGSRLCGRMAGGDDLTIAVVTGGGTAMRVPIDHVEAIEFRSPRVTFASDLRPAEAKFEPYLPAAWPPRMDRAVSNRPIRLGGREYAKGIGVHSRSELAFDVEGKYRLFAATIGIDDAVRPRGDVVFRVVADDREVFVSGPVSGRDPPRPIRVEIGGARRVRLIVEYAGQFDIGDHADWAEARFIR